MLQRSTHESPVDVPAIPATVQPGDVVDWPTPIAGFQTVPDVAPPPSPEPTSKRSKAAPAPAPTGEEPTQ